MHTTGLVLTLADDPPSAHAALAELAAAGPFTLGQATGLCWSAVLEAADPKASHDWHDWAAALPGVDGVEVVFVHWDDEAEPEAMNARD